MRLFSWPSVNSLALAAACFAFGCGTSAKVSLNPNDAGTAGKSGDGGSDLGTGGTTSGTACGSGNFAWPNGAALAVSLTYDDALPSQVKFAVPALDAKSLKATFFLSEFWWEFEAYKPEYMTMRHNGHELAAHTSKHPCEKELAGYTMEAMAAELDGNIATLRALGEIGPLTFAYPCGHTRLGATSSSYVPIVTERFAAARSGTPASIDISTLDLSNVPSVFPPSEATAQSLIGQVEQAKSKGSWPVFGFHGVTEQGEYLNIPKAAHDGLMEYLSAHSSELWVAPFRTVAEHVAACR